MELTAFLPFFVVLVVVALRSPAHWLAATGFACFLQGASPFIVTAGGRLAGMAPAYLLTFIGLFHYVRVRVHPAARAPGEQPWSAPQLWLWAFTLIGVLGALLLPRVFNGVAHAMLSRGSINTATMTDVAPGSTNIIQAFYLALNLALFSIAATLVAARADGLRAAMRGVAAGLGLACVLGLYQLVAYYAGLPWPSDIVNSNVGVGQFPDQMAGSGIKRITATFWEPSLLGYSFVGCLGIFLLGGRSPRLGLLALCVLMLSTSSLGYFGLAALVGVWLFADREASATARWRVAFGLATVCAVFVIADQVMTGGVVLENLVLNKAESSSGVGRSTADRLALQTFLESGGLGVGVGTTRASSFAATLLATTGLPGLIAFLAFALTLILQCRRAGDPDSRALGLGLTGFLIVWIIAIPDVVQALFWLVAGVAAGHLRRQRVTRPAGIATEAVPWPAR
jgi:hypothetical protein